MKSLPKSFFDNLIAAGIIEQDERDSSYELSFEILEQTHLILKENNIITDSNLYITGAFGGDEDVSEELEESKIRFARSGTLTIYNDSVSIIGKSIHCRISIGDGENQTELRLNMHNLFKLGELGLSRILEDAMRRLYVVNITSITIINAETSIDLEKDDRIFLLITYSVR